MVARLLKLWTLVALAAVFPTAANASELIDRNASAVSLQVSTNGQALLTYRAAGKLRHVLAWGAINAIAPTRSRAQVSFRLDYSGGWGTYHKDVWKTFKNACGPYDGAELQWLVTACKASDGTYWALQSWQRQLPNVGLKPTPAQAVWELHLSHWSGELPQFIIKTDWAYRRYDHLYGSFSFRGNPVFGFRSTAQGVTLDSYGRNVYVDTYNSAYGPGWKRENSFLTHNPGGNFCYGFYPGQNNSNRPPGKGEAYRATVIGPGVTPDMFWQGAAPGAYSRELDLQANEDQRQFAAQDKLCRPN